MCDSAWEAVGCCWGNRIVFAGEQSLLAPGRFWLNTGAMKLYRGNGMDISMVIIRVISW